MDGFEVSCEGIVGDGCGGGRVFGVKDETLYALDPVTKDEIVLLKNIKNVKAISKKTCLITITCKDETIKFDLSTLSIV